MEIEFLKDVLSDETYGKLTEELEGKEEVKLANLKSGEYVSKEKYTALEGTVNELKTQLSDKNNSYDKLLAKVGDNEALKTEIEKLKTTSAQQLEETTQKYESKLKGAAINTALMKAKAKDATDIIGLLKLDDIKYENNELFGFDEQLNKIKENKPYLFEDEKKDKRSGMSHEDNSNLTDMNKLRASFGLPLIK